MRKYPKEEVKNDYLGNLDNLFYMEILLKKKMDRNLKKQLNTSRNRIIII
jgi:hypothetical protein